MMKRNALLGLMAACCCLTAHAMPVTRGEARQVAAELVQIDDATGDDAEVSPYYIFSRGKGKGFVIVSGDDSTTPVIGYTETGDFEPDKLPPTLLSMLDAWGEAIGRVQVLRRRAQVRSPRARALASYKKDWVDVPALVKTHWHQSSPYNDLAPFKNGQRCMTGCVATAGSQVAYYFRRDNPTALQHDTPTYGYGTPITVSLPKGTPLEWNQMRLSGSGTEQQNNAVATLMYALGTSAWLTYGDGDGLATSGHNYKMADAMQSQLRLSYSHKYKSEFTQEAWERLIYSNLTTRRPMLYSGVSEGSGGHSVVLDGYKASTGLYHFNFGWGGQGDGWYTVDDATGMNGFNQYQDLVYDITPQVPNISGHVNATQVYHRATCPVEVVIENNGTLDYQGVYVYTNSRPQLPSQSSASDVRTVVGSDGSARLTFNITPTYKDNMYIFLCGKNRRVLDTCLVEVIPTHADLSLQQIGVDAGQDVVSVDGMDFGVVNSTTASVSVRLRNGDDGTFCQPTFRCFLDKYDEDSKTWARVASASMSTLVFNERQTRDTVFTFEGLTPGVLYKAYLNNTAQASEQSEIKVATRDSTALFTVREADLSVAVTDGRRATVTGRWNGRLFALQTTDANICSYDISQVTDLSHQPVASNPNALFYATADRQSWMKYDNVVVGDECGRLTVSDAAAFVPSAPFTARKATFVMSELPAGEWRASVVPFAAQVPLGMQVKAPASVTNNMIAFGHVTSIEAMSPVIYVTGHHQLHSIEATDVSIGTDSIAEWLDGRLVSATVAMPIEDKWLVPQPFIGTVYYMTDSERSETLPFESYYASATGKNLRTSATTMTDTYYTILCDSIEHVYSAISGASDSQSLANVVDELNMAETMLTMRSAQTDDEISQQAVRLGQALAKWMSTAIDGIAQPETDASAALSPRRCFNLSGQRVDGRHKGLVIVRANGRTRKIFVK